VRGEASARPTNKKVEPAVVASGFALRGKGIGGEGKVVLEGGSKAGGRVPGRGVSVTNLTQNTHKNKPHKLDKKTEEEKGVDALTRPDLELKKE